jgi:hypothetical protein
MDGKGGLTFPNIGNNIVQSSITGAFSRNIAHSTKIPNFKFWLYILRGYGTSFGKVVKRTVMKFGTRNSRSIRKEKARHLLPLGAEIGLPAKCAGSRLPEDGEQAIALFSSSEGVGICSAGSK